MAEKNRKNKKKSGLAIALWLFAFLVILIFFLVKQDEIKTNLKNTGFFDRIFGHTPSFIIEHEEKNPQKSFDDSDDIVLLLTETDNNTDFQSVSEPEKVKTDSTMEAAKNSEEKRILSTEEKKSENAFAVDRVEKSGNIDLTHENVATSTKTEEKSSSTVEEKIEKKDAAPETIKARVCFVAIDSDGSVVRKEISRNVRKSAPLTDSLKFLLEGPSDVEKKSGCRSLIPDGTRLIGVSVRDGIATVNFSGEFEFNSFGIEGSLAQLMQVVYTATYFSTVKSVQILIDGQKKDYLGSEGVWVGSPLSRNTF